MLFADNIVLVDETARSINIKLKPGEKNRSQKTLGSVRRSKTEYMECKFSGSQSASADTVALQ